MTVGVQLTFRAELMPGRDANERTFEVTRVLSNQRVELDKLEGQHSLAEFEEWKKISYVFNDEHEREND